MKWRAVLGLIVGAFLIVNSFGHTILGWRALGTQLARGGAPSNLIDGIHIGWQFGGVGMFTFGLIAVVIFLQRLRGALVSTLPTMLIGVVYVAFGAWAMYASGNPFFLILVLPGSLLALASTRAR
ncbi:MAG TPA: hypothetical protein VGQ76_20215 [Thermoanaerobaculia bacterium]|jgi:hypothetical protein|nr:hypothetical protein [Thermoanaerobaculia bacterium]